MTFPVSFPAQSEDAQLFTEIVNQGIDAHLEAFTKLQSHVSHEHGFARLHIDFDESELPLLLRRLYEHESEDAERWADDIAECEFDLEII